MALVVSSLHFTRRSFAVHRRLSMEDCARHIFVCVGDRCADKGAGELLDAFKARKKAGTLEAARLTRTGCMKLCKDTDTEGEYSPVVLVYPDGVWYGPVGTGDVDEIIEEHINKGQVVRRLVRYRSKG